MLPSGDLIGVHHDWCLVSVGVEVEGIRADVRTVNVGVVGGVGEESSVVVNFREWRTLGTASRELRWATPS